MPNVEQFFDKIDAARIGRLRDLSEIKRIFTTQIATDPLSIGPRSVIVLTYAAWEGFYNECVTIYLDFLDSINLSVSAASWFLLTAALSTSFNSLKDRHHSLDARMEFVEGLKNIQTYGFADIDRSIVSARSNLDFLKVTENFKLLDFNNQILQRHRNKIDKELVQWRHGVAHGGYPNLSALDIGSHIEFTSNLLLIMSDLFQEAILSKV